MQKRMFKELERQATVMWGYDPKKKRREAERKRLAEEWQKNPLYGFPYDIEYLNDEQIAAKVSISKRFWNKIAPDKLWDFERADSCRGAHGIVAKRCSMNDKLWSIYQRAKSKKVLLTLADVKKMILIDIKRSKLYPPGWTDDTVSPPEWYVNRLRERGLLDRILEEIDEATRMGVA